VNPRLAFTRLLLALVASVCGMVLVLGYRTPRLPHDRLAGRVAVGPPRAQSLAPNCGGADGVSRSVTGPWRAWSLGHLRVRVTMAGCRIVDVEATGLATTNPVSGDRSAMAVAQLRGEVLSRQCAGVDVVSGATYTSQAYLHSLQAALDTARAARPCP
jgi:uncharacterized protein with FMN-binding domain